MTEQIQLFRPADSGWQACVDRTDHDFYHTAAYHLYSERYKDGEAWLAVYGDQHRFLALPYLIRDIEGQKALRDVTSVYGYAGPLVCGEMDKEFEWRAWAAIERKWREQSVVSAFARLHPLLDNQSHVVCFQTGGGSGECGSCELVELGPTVSLDLRQTDEEAWRGYRRSVRHEVKKARALGLVTRVDEDWAHLDTFVELYIGTMQRNQASSYYYFGREQILDLKKALGRDAVLAHVWCEDKIISSCVFVEYNGYLHAHLEGNHPEYLKLTPFKLMVDDMRVWARARGGRALHLGGGRGASEDSLFLFKSGLSQRRHRFFVAKWIVDPDRYDALVENRRSSAAAKGLAFEPGAYFPAYRALPARPVAAAASEPDRELALA